MTDGGFEKQYLAFPFELKEMTEEGVFSGYASVFNKVDSYNDVVHYGAFAKTLKRKGPKGIKLLWQHLPQFPIGNHLDLFEDGKGLFIKAALALLMIRNTETPAVPKAWEAYTLLKLKSIDGLSIGFYADPKKNPWDKDEDVRHLHEVDLWENSVVTFQAQGRAKVTQVKKIFQAGNPRELEQALCDAGVSTQEAKFLACRHDFAKRDAGSLDLLHGIVDSLKQLKIELEK